MSKVHMNAESLVIRIQEISLYIPASEIESNIDSVRIVISSDGQSRPKSITLPAYFFDEAKVYMP